MGKYLEQEKLGLVLNAEGSSSDMMNFIIEHLKQTKWVPKTFVFNLERAAVKNLDELEFFKNVEKLKDGNIVSYKYKGAKKKIPSPYLLIFMNEQPPDSWLKLLSKDRWRISNIPPLTEADLALIAAFKEASGTGVPLPMF